MEHTNIERETVILYNQAEKEARVCTEDPVLIRKLTSILRSGNVLINMVSERDGYLEVLVPKKWVKVSPPRQLTEDQKVRARERMMAFHEAKKEVTE